MSKKRTREDAESGGIIIGENIVRTSRVRQLSSVLDVGTEDIDVSSILDHLRDMVSSDVFLTTMAVLLCMVSLLPVQRVSNIHEMLTMLRFLCIPENVLIAAYQFSSVHLLPLYQACLVQVMTKATIKKRFLELVPEEITSWCSEHPTITLNDCPFHPQLYIYVRKHLDQFNLRNDSCTNLIRYMIEMSHEHVCERLEKSVPAMIQLLQDIKDPKVDVVIQSIGFAWKEMPKFYMSVIKNGGPSILIE